MSKSAKFMTADRTFARWSRTLKKYVSNCPICITNFVSMTNTAITTHLEICMREINATSSIQVLLTPPDHRAEKAQHICEKPDRAHLYAPKLEKWYVFPDDYKWTPKHMQQNRMDAIYLMRGIRQKQRAEEKKEMVDNALEQLELMVAENLNRTQARYMWRKNSAEIGRLRHRLSQPAQSVADVARVARNVQASHKRMMQNSTKNLDIRRPAAKLNTIDPRTIPSLTKSSRRQGANRPTVKPKAVQSMVEKTNSLPSPLDEHPMPSASKHPISTLTTTRTRFRSMRFTCADELEQRSDLYNAHSESESGWSSDSDSELSSVSTCATTPPLSLAQRFQRFASSPVKADNLGSNTGRPSHVTYPIAPNVGELNAERLGIAFTCADTLQPTKDSGANGPPKTKTYAQATIADPKTRAKASIASPSTVDPENKDKREKLYADTPYPTKKSSTNIHTSLSPSTDTQGKSKSAEPSQKTKQSIDSSKVKHEDKSKRKGGKREQEWTNLPI